MTVNANMAWWDRLAREVDARMQRIAWGDGPAVLCGVRLKDRGRFVLVPFWSGVAREMPLSLTPPDECVAIALGTKGWKAPMDDLAGEVTPAEHPGRVRIYHTCLVYGDDEGTEVSVLSSDDAAESVVLRNGTGAVLDLQRICWSRRRNR